MDIDRRERRADVMKRKIAAIFIAVAGTVLPCLLAGAMVGLFIPSIFWGCVAYISAFALFFMMFDRVPVRLYHGTLNHMRISQLIQYGFTSTDRWPILTISDILGFGWMYRRYYRYKR